MARTLLAVAALLMAGGAPAAADVPAAVAVLESFTPAFPHQVPDAAPPRFVLMESGQFYVGGTNQVAEGRLDKDELDALLRRLDFVRKLPWLAGRVELGPGEERFRLVLRRGRPIDMTIHGDPKRASMAVHQLGLLLEKLMGYHQHQSLRPYQPAQYALRTREGVLPGGCRPWRLAEPPSASVFAPIVVPASAATGWPTGADPAAVCHGDKRYVVTFRPLLPGEMP